MAEPTAAHAALTRVIFRALHPTATRNVPLALTYAGRVAADVLAHLTSAEAIERAARSVHEHPNPWQLASGDWGAAGYEIQAAFMVQQCAAILAAAGEVTVKPSGPKPPHRRFRLDPPHGDTLHWVAEGPIPGDSRTEHVTIRRERFWGGDHD